MSIEGQRVLPKASELGKAETHGLEMRYGWKAVCAALMCCAHVLSFFQHGFPGQQTINYLSPLKILEF